ncbi:MAG TPA: hypothetical protein VGI58_05715 [Streptosporangiaceae bacterium]
MSADLHAIDWLLRYQHGVLSRAQAISAGMTLAQVRHRVRAGGPWQRLLPGVYLTSTGAPTWEQRQVAALLSAGPASMITGTAALLSHRISSPAPGLVDVLVPMRCKRASCDFVVFHRTRRLPAAFACDGPLRFALPARAVADAVRDLTELSAARAIVGSAVQKRRCSVADLVTELRAGPVRGSASLRAALAEVADGVRSAAEGDFRRLILRSGLPRPLFNATLLLDGRLLAIADAWWPQAGLVVEIDSREWHLSPADWEQTMHRHARMTAAGLRVLHVSPRQVRDEGKDVLQLIASAHRTGRRVPDVTWRPAAA